MFRCAHHYQRKKYSCYVCTMIGLISQVNSAPKVSLAHNCKEVYNGGCTTSGVYTIDPGCGKALQMCCDMDGQREIIQKRMDGSVDFYCKWTSYVDGFSDLEG